MLQRALQTRFKMGELGGAGGSGGGEASLGGAIVDRFGGVELRLWWVRCCAGFV